MRFEVSYPSGVTHEVEPPGSSAVFGRDPGCDVVLNDTKCSRRHAIVEEREGRLIVRDTGSANGIYVNGRRVDRALLAPGDSIRLGDVQLRVLAELGSTMRAEVALPSASSDPPALHAAGGRPRAGSGAQAQPSPHPARLEPPRPAAQPVAPAAAAAPARRAAPGHATIVDDTGVRPLTVTLLAGLWALFVPASVAALLYGASTARVSPTGWAVAAGSSACLAGLGVAMAIGLRALAVWAYRLQIATAAVGLFVCPFTLASVTVLLYMTRPEVKQAFFGGGSRAGAGPAEPTFALSLVGMLGLGLAVTAVALLMAGPGR
jgi:hypothetical protein